MCRRPGFFTSVFSDHILLNLCRSTISHSAVKAGATGYLILLIVRGRGGSSLMAIQVSRYHYEICLIRVTGVSNFNGTKAWMFPVVACYKGGGLWWKVSRIDALVRLDVGLSLPVS